MILIQDIVNSMAAKLDAETPAGTTIDYYTFNNDYMPAINDAIEWITSIVTPMIGTKKFSEEAFAESTLCKIWQTSAFSRIMFDPSVMPYNSDIWTILSVRPKPKVYLESLTTVGTPVPYYSQVVSYVGTENDNKPIVSLSYATGNALKPFESTIRPELAFVSSKHSARRLTIEETAEAADNPFATGYDSPFQNCDEMTEYGFANVTDYTATVGGYTLSVPREIQIYKRLYGDLVAVFYIPVPTPIKLITDTVAFPTSMKGSIIAKALSFIAYKEGDGSTLLKTATSDLMSILSTK